VAAPFLLTVELLARKVYLPMLTQPVQPLEVMAATVVMASTLEDKAVTMNGVLTVEPGVAAAAVAETVAVEQHLSQVLVAPVLP
jgi:hypothetical protein